MTVEHWLIEYVVLKAENAAVYTLSAGMVTTLVLVPFRAGLKKIWRAVDSLDPKTDTGVTEQLRELDAKLTHRPLPPRR